jgi:hypothetical protein
MQYHAQKSASHLRAKDIDAQLRDGVQERNKCTAACLASITDNGGSEAGIDFSCEAMVRICRLNLHLFAQGTVLLNQLSSSADIQFLAKKGPGDRTLGPICHLNR